jgi:uncharacterized protein YjbI with pentapeptide repeats
MTATKVKTFTGVGDATTAAIGFTNTGNVYVYDEESAFAQGTFYFINWATSTVQTLGTSGTPSILGGDYDPVRNVFWVGDEWNGKIYQLSLTNSAIEWTSNSTWSTGNSGDFYDLDVTPDGDILAVAYASPATNLTIQKIDPVTKTWTKFLDLPAGTTIDRIATLKEVSYIGGNFSNRDFAWQDLSRINFTGSIFQGANFRGANIKNSNFGNSNMAKVQFMDADLTGANLSGVVFSNATFTRGTLWPLGFVTAGKGMWGPKLDYTGQNLSGKDFAWHDFLEANFSSANLTGTNFRGARLDKVNFTSANMANVQFMDADLTGANLSGVVFSNATFTRGTLWPSGFVTAGKGMWGPKLDYSGQNLSGKGFAWYDFLESNFTGANLQSVDFRGAQLDKANFTNADIRQASFRDADLTGAVLTGVNLTSKGSGINC